jgi:drug/metabolite transporter (DMT)-like permease
MDAPVTPPGQTHHARGVMLMVASTAFFTVHVLVIRALSQIEAVNVWLFSCVRFTVGLALIALVYRREWRPTQLYRNPKLVSRGLVGGASVYLFYLTIVHLGAGRAVFINNTYVIFGALLAVAVLRERLGAALAIGGIVTLTGLALLTNAFAANTHPTVYDLVAVIGAFCSSYVVVTIRQLHATEHTSTIFAAQCVYGLLLCTVPAVLHRTTVAPLAWAVMLLAGLFAAAGQIAMTRAFRDLPVAEGSLLQMLVPVGTALGGCLFFAERFSPHELVGAALILAGTAFTAARR